MFPGAIGTDVANDIDPRHRRTPAAAYKTGENEGHRSQHQDRKNANGNSSREVQPVRPCHSGFCAYS